MTTPETGPAAPAIDVRLDGEGTGAAAMPWEHVLARIPDLFAAAVAEVVPGAIEVVGLRVIDGAGREIADPFGGGKLVVGFRFATD